MSKVEGGGRGDDDWGKGRMEVQTAVVISDSVFSRFGGLICEI